MPRGQDASRTTLFQLEALAQAVHQRNVAKAAESMGIADKHRLIKAIDRLGDNVGLSLSQRIGDETVGLDRLAEAADKILIAWREFQEAADVLGTRPVLIRCQALPSMVYIFLSAAVAAFEDRHRPDDTSESLASVRFFELESGHRDNLGASLLPALERRLVDLCIAPTAYRNDTDVPSTFLYSWRVVAAITSEHPLRERCYRRDGQWYVDLDAVAEFPVLVSPRGHWTRRMLEERPPLGGFTIDLESTNSMARVALGSAGWRVPLIASDGVPDHMFDRTWPAVVRSDGKPLTESFDVFWRNDLSGAVQERLDEFVEDVRVAAEVLRSRPGGNAGE